MAAPRPLEGVRVIELSVLLQGPVAGMALAELGADVIKVEPPAGDPVRGLRVSFDMDTTLPNGMNTATATVNRGKRSLTLDLKSERGRDLLLELVARSEVFVSNLRSEALRSFGADFASLRSVNPRLVYAHGTGLGEEGPWAGKPAQDTIGMAHSGFLSALSQDGETPMYPTGSLSDVISGTALAMGVLAALRVRDATGEAQYVSASQLQAMLWTQMMNVTLGANIGVTPRPVDRTNVFNPLFNVYRAGDGRWFTLNALQPRAAWPVFCSAVEHGEWIEDPRFSGIRARSENRRELIALLDVVFASRPRDEWLALLSGVGLWVGQVNSPTELAGDEQVRANGYLCTTDDGITSPRAPFRIAGVDEPAPAGAPPLSRDSDAILGGLLGLSEDAVLQLKADGIVW